MATLLLELFSEEIPSRMQRNAAEQLERLILDGFKKNMLQPTGVKTFVSPRHLAIQCAGLPTIQPDVSEERRGPKIGAPEQALKGFLQSTGLTLEQCEQRDGYYYARLERKGRAVAEVVKEVCEAALSAFGWPKSMRWGARPLQWVRPLHNIVCLLDDKIVPVQFAHLTAGNVTFGHRFLAPEAITITNAKSYEQQLLTAKVMVDFAARKETIRTGVAAVAAQQKLAVIDDEALLDEVTGLVEWPVPLLGTFEEKFLQLPPEVLISEMKTHQRYFALNDAGGKLTNRFITVANMVNADGGKKVMEGNSRVVRARLSDGEFYWEQDKKTNLADWGKKLADVVFHAKVGMMDAKVQRIEKLALQIAKAVGFEKDPALIERAARLCKADLTSGMVSEFPELQGIMGRYYANAQGEHNAVAEAIYEHYKPQGAGDSLPESHLGAIISVADKFDSIIELFKAGEKPTGSKDPLALRRAALGIIRILQDRNQQAYQANKDPHLWELDIETLGATPEVVDFFIDRLKVVLREKGLRPDVIEAVMVRKYPELRMGNLLLHEWCAKIVSDWLNKEQGKKELTSIKRVYSMLAAEEKKGAKVQLFTDTLAATLDLPAEKELIKELNVSYRTFTCNFARLQQAIDAFFDAVLITEAGKKEARLALLGSVRQCVGRIADFSKIEG